MTWLVGFVMFSLGWLLGWSMQRAVLYGEFLHRQVGARDELVLMRCELRSIERAIRGEDRRMEN